MEEFKKLNWNHPLEEETCFVSGEVLKEKSLIYKVLKGTFKNYLSSDSSDEPYEDESNKKNIPKKQKKKKKTKTKKNTKTAKTDNVNDNMNEDGVRYSALTIAQHAAFLEVLLAVQNQMASVPAQYCALKETVEKEQNDFQEHIKNLWSNSLERHCIISDDAKKYTEDKWKLQLKRVKSYPKLYKLEKTIPLIYPPEHPDIEIIPVKMLLEMGVVPKLHVPNVNLLPKISTNYAQMLLLNVPKPEDFKSLQNISVSKDKNAEILALKEMANIVISSSGLKCLADNVSSTFDKVWSIPVEIKLYKIKDGSSVKEHKIVFIDKKLPPKSMTATERNAWFHKLAVKSFLFHPRDPQSFRYPENEHFDTHIEIINEAENAVDNIEIGSLCKECGFPLGKGSGNKNCASDSDAESVSSLVIDSEREESIPETQTCKCTSKEEGGNLPIPPSSKSNVTYRLWKLFCGESSRENVCEALLKRPNLSPELKILVRCKMDACESENNKVRPVCVSSKMEHQAEYGAEKLNLSMLVKEWLSLLFRPEASLTRLRINTLTEEIFLSEKSNLRDLTLLVSNHFDFRIKRRILGSLFQVMSDLMLLKPGQYLLTHDTRSGPFISVLQKEDGNFTYDLYADYESVNPSIIKKDIPPWNPIDTNIITPMHIAAKRVPASFEPCK